jgi:hypothetical protein
MGGQVFFAQVNANPNVQNNGAFQITGTETGVDFADFLLGIASSYTQGQAQSFYNRDRYLGSFVQDNWRTAHRLTLNYGLRWEPIAPWHEKYNQIQTMVLGEQSVVFPGAPSGLVVPGDPGIPSTIAPTRWNDLSPRVGLAYSPREHGGLLGWLLGGPDKSSIHAGFGRFFMVTEGISAGTMSGNAPFGNTYSSPAPPLMETPFISAANGANQGQRFPLTLPPQNTSAANPDPNVDWALYEPITGIPGFAPSNRSAYATQYNLSFQRQFGNNTLFKMGYVGSQAHHLLVLVENNPGNPALCLSVSQPSEVMPGTATCGPFGEDATYVTAVGKVINGTRSPFGQAFGSDTYQAALGNSNFNALETTLRHSGKRFEFLAGYTFSKSLDDASSLGDPVNPPDHRLLYSPSEFDLKHNFLLSYGYDLTGGWFLSGITRFTTGFPVTLDNNTDSSLLGTQPNGVSIYGVDEPDYTPPLGSAGTAKRRMFYGPGSANFDVALRKRFHLTKSVLLDLRLEAFNVFNHTQFFGPETVGDDVNSPSFGEIVSSAPPRLCQVATKITF